MVAVPQALRALARLRGQFLGPCLRLVQLRHPLRLRLLGLVRQQELGLGQLEWLRPLRQLGRRAGRGLRPTLVRDLS